MKHMPVLLFLCLVIVLANAAGPPLPPPGELPDDSTLSKNCQTPKCPQTGAGSKDKPVALPFPLDCLQYILCDGTKPRVLACPPDLVFNKNTGACDTREKANCVPCWQQ